ncbi:MAG: penicillin acylase family protein, partial [Saprospiraceae bacterium]|nr:penicillin acylase family protein [Saprospiraceae bacterium]
MRLFKFFLALVFTVFLVWFADTHHPLGTQLPPVGKLFNPFTGFWQNAEPTHRPAAQTLEFPQLTGGVEIAFDKRMVPHLFAEATLDAIFTQGYLHARDRLWQMDFYTRSAAGRLSEVLGEVTLEYDRLQRRKGMVFAAENALANWDDNSAEAQAIAAYVAGINAYIAQLDPGDYPLEFKLLDYEPEEWSPMKVALTFKNMADILCSRNDDIPATHALELLGRPTFDFLYPEANPRQSPIIPAGTPWNFDPVRVEPMPLELPGSGQLSQSRPLPPPPAGLGSNNWAISGSRTRSGNPILCNDPHLRLTFPSIWYEMQMSSPDFNSYGVSIPGLPGILIGFNEHIAWGETNVGHDVLDWYEIEWRGEERGEYRLDGQWVKPEIREEVIRVRGRERPVRDTVKYTHWGPVVFESPDHPVRDLAQRWVAHDATDAGSVQESATFLQLMAAREYGDYQRALRHFESPAQNFVFASRDGDIAITVNGKLPLRFDQQGRFVQPGDRTAYGWQGFIPREHLPQIRNPQRGYVSSANQRSTDLTYPYYYHAPFDDYRGRLINRMLDTMQSVGFSQMKRLQTENYSLLAEEALPLLRKLLGEVTVPAEDSSLLSALEKWDFRFEAEARAPVIFESWLRESYAATFDEITALQDSLSVPYPQYWRFLDLLRSEPGHAIFDLASTEEREQARDIVRRSFFAALEEVGPSIREEGLNWAARKGTRIQHLARISAFSSSTLDMGGYGEAPNAVKEEHGPSWRMIVELGPRIRAWGVYPGGQSGNPGSPFYDQMIDTWRQGEYYELFFMTDPED